MVSAAITPGQIGPKSDSNKWLLRIPQRSRIADAHHQIV